MVHGGKVAIRSPEHAVAAGIGYLSEDRKRFGVAVGMDVESNVVMGNLDTLSVVRVVPARRANPRQRRTKFVKLLNIRTPS